MPVMEKRRTALPPEARNLPTVKYPPEVIDRLDAIREITEAQIAAGELRPMTAAEFAAQYGITLDD